MHTPCSSMYAGRDCGPRCCVMRAQGVLAAASESVGEFSGAVQVSPARHSTLMLLASYGSLSYLLGS
jgi:hypothetical protein